LIQQQGHQEMLRYSGALYVLLDMIPRWQSLLMLFCMPGGLLIFLLARELANKQSVWHLCRSNSRKSICHISIGSYLVWAKP